ncbi:MAG: Methyl-accepting chemotaxis protein, partial [uncultured bacterium]
PGAPIKLEEKSIRLGRIPYRSLREMMTQAVPLLRLLQKKTGAKEVRLVSNRNDYASVIDALARGNIDFAWVGPTAYLSRRDKDALMPVAKAKFGSETAYRGVFIAPAKGKVQGLEDIKGSRIGFVDPESASGYIYPLYLLLRLGINPHTDATVYFLKNHDNVLRAILAGKLDVGVCLEDTLNSLKDKNLQDKIIVLAKTNEIPSDVIVCRQDCPINLRERFFEALLSVKANELPGSPTFMQAFDEDFVEVEAIMKYINSLKKKK